MYLHWKNINEEYPTDMKHEEHGRFKKWVTVVRTMVLIKETVIIS